MSKLSDFIGFVLGANAPNCKICRRYSETQVCKRCDSAIRESAEAKTCRDIAGTLVHFPYSYTPQVRFVLKKFKFEDKQFLAGILAQYMTEIFSTMQYDMLTYVPLHKKRYAKRGYNQSQLLACALDHGAKELLVRTRNTTPQYRVPPNMRRQNVEGAFEVAKSAELQGKKILVVDDIVTTGSTITSVASALKSAGASEVCAIAFASAGESKIRLH